MTNADAIFDFLANHPTAWNGAFTALYLTGQIEPEDYDFWTASPERWMALRNFYQLNGCEL